MVKSYKIFSSGAGSIEPISVPSRMKKTATDHPELPALKTRDPKTGQEVSKIRLYAKSAQWFLKRLVQCSA